MKSSYYSRINIPLEIYCICLKFKLSVGIMFVVFTTGKFKTTSLSSVNSNTNRWQTHDKQMACIYIKSSSICSKAECSLNNEWMVSIYYILRAMDLLKRSKWWVCFCWSLHWRVWWSDNIKYLIILLFVRRLYLTGFYEVSNVLRHDVNRAFSHRPSHTPAYTITHTLIHTCIHHHHRTHICVCKCVY